MDWDMILGPLLLAQDAAGNSPHDGLPGWAKYIMGPLGAMVLLGVYAFYTEKVRIPNVIAQILEAQKELKMLRDSHKVEMDELRTKCEVEEKRLEDDIQRWRDKHTKERTARAWWQSKAEDFAKRLGEDSGIPPDIDKTHYRDEG